MPIEIQFYTGFITLPWNKWLIIANSLNVLEHLEGYSIKEKSGAILSLIFIRADTIILYHLYTYGLNNEQSISQKDKYWINDLLNENSSKIHKKKVQLGFKERRHLKIYKKRLR